MSGREPEEGKTIPPDEWWTGSYAKGNVRINFYNIYGQVESLAATWIEDNVFALDETPLLVNGLSIEDEVEVEWREGEVIPYFLRVKRRSIYRTFRVELSGPGAANPRLKEFLRRYTSGARIHQDVLAFSVYTGEHSADDSAVEWLMEEFGLWAEETNSAEGRQNPARGGDQEK